MPLWRQYALPAFLFVMVIAIMLAGGHALSLNTAYHLLNQAPEGQSIGPPDAPVTIVEFMDYRCVPCRQVYPLVKQIAEKHPEVRVVFRNMPISVSSILENRVALAAGMQGKYMAMHDLLMQRSEPVKEQDLPELCKQAGVDYLQLQKDLKGRTVTETLDRTLDSAKMLGIVADPTFLVGKDIYVTNRGMPTIDDFETMINRAKVAARKAGKMRQVGETKGS